MTIRAFILALILLPLDGFASINEFKDKAITVRAFIDVPTYSVEIQNHVNTANKIVWKPNLRTFTGVDFAINGFIGAGVSWANNDDPGSAQKKGITEYNDYRANITFKNFYGRATYQHFHGFYIENTQEINPTIPRDTYLQDSSMIGDNIEANATFVLHPEDFSYTALLGQDVRQESSGGSLLLGVAGSRTAFNNSNGLIPVSVRSRFGEDQNVTSMEFHSLNAKIGYGYSFIWSQAWFFSIVIEGGGGVEYRTYGDQNLKTSATGGSTKADGIVGFGYNGDRFLASIVATGSTTTYTTKSLDVPSNIGDARMHIGMHF